MEHSFHPGELLFDTNGVPVNAHGGGILRFGDFFYWYGEHKGPGEKGNRAFDGVHVYRSRDLFQWEDRGLALDIRNGRIPELPPGCVLERPKVLFCAQTGKFVMWVHFEGNQNDYRMAHCGTAVSDSPEGPFIFRWHGRADTGTKPLSMRNAEFSRKTMEEHRKTYDILPGSECPEAMNVDYMSIGYFLGQDSRDMTLFQDDDGKAYLVYSPRSTARCIFPSSRKTSPDFPACGNGCSSNAGWKPHAFSSTGDAIISSDPGVPDGLPTQPGPPSRIISSVRGPSWGIRRSTRTASSPTTPRAHSSCRWKAAVILHGDRWNPENAIDGRYVWLPIEWEDGRPVIRNRKEWSFS